MGVTSDVVTKLNQVASGVGATRAIIEHGKAIASHVSGNQAQQDQKKVSFSVILPESGYKNVPLLAEGTAYLPVQIDTTDAEGNVNEAIRKVTPVKGEFATMLVFTALGLYEVKFIMGSENITKQISISNCPNCPNT